MTIWERIRSAFATIRIAGGSKVTVVPPGKDGDGITRRIGGGYGTDIDKPDRIRYDDIQDSLEAWRKHPLARRIVNLVTAYVIGDGVRISSKYTPLQRFIDEFWQHDRNRILLRQADWCDELTRSGELFLVLFTNPQSGMSHVRSVPASRIDEIEWKKDDYEVELRYHEIGDSMSIDDRERDGTWWHSFDHPDAGDPTVPIMLHFAVNRPIGAVRGEGDLTPILQWLARYSNWLEDRVRLNAGMRSFLWIIYARGKQLKDDLAKHYHNNTPKPGSIIVAEEGAEKWEAIAPNLHAADAAEDGRAIRWMIAAGGPGTGLTDFGEAFDANQATATVMVDIRRRFLKRRQAYFNWMLVELTLRAYQRSRINATASRRNDIGHMDFIIDAPDISGEDNMALAAAGRDLTIALTSLQEIMGDSQEFREVAIRMFAKFVEEDIARPIAEAIVTKGAVDRDRKQRLAEEKIVSEIQKNKQSPKAPK